MPTATQKKVSKTHKTVKADNNDSRLKETEAIVSKYVKIAAGAGLVPMPFWDVAAVFSAHVAMVKEMADAYGVPFTEARVKHLVGALIGGLGAPMLGHGVIGSFVKSIPGIGTVAGLLTVPALAAASAYATGQVFIRHFQSGGTFLNFDPSTMEDYYRGKFQEGKEATKGVVKKVASSVKGVKELAH